MSEIVTLREERDYVFTIELGGTAGTLRSDLPPPLGGGSGASPEHLLCAAVGSCLSSSLLFSLRKFKQAPEPIRATVEPEVGRNEQKRLRVLRLKARIDLGVPAAKLGEHLDKALAQFEDFCTVTASVRQSLPVDVEVYDADGTKLK